MELTDSKPSRGELYLERGMERISNFILVKTFC